MSRPPKAHAGASTTRAIQPGRRRLDYLPSEYAELLAREEALSAQEVGAPTGAREGDMGHTLLELSALVGHVLGLYQDRYASEAFIGTASSHEALVRHGRRLAYEPDPGLSAVGYARLTVKDGQRGVVAPGFAIASAPEGDKKSQHYETLHETKVDARHNQVRPRAWLEPYELPPSRDRFFVSTPDVPLAVGAPLVLEMTSGALHAARLVVAVDQDDATTELRVAPALPASLGAFPPARVHARPAFELAPFGAKAPPDQFTEQELAAGLLYSSNAPGYIDPDTPAIPTPFLRKQFYLQGEVDGELLGRPVLLVDDRPGLKTVAAHRVSAERRTTVAFKKTVDTTVPTPTPNDPNATITVPVSSAISAAVTALELDGGAVKRFDGVDAYPIRTLRVLGHFELVMPVVRDVRSPATVQPPQATVASAPMEVAGAVDFEPGMFIELARDPALDGPGVSEIAVISRVLEVPSGTSIQWRLLDADRPARVWKLGELVIRGNVARVGHGKSEEETLGGSDGQVAFASFELAKSPVAHLPGPAGGEPALEVRVGGVRYARVQDFSNSRPEDRHYVTRRDAEGVTTVVFGDGRSGAVPPAGARNVTAAYRVGLGRGGNAPAGAVHRIVRAHPLIAAAVNPRALGGGADPAGAEDVRTQATKHIQTFERATSLPDHAHLAMLFPGVARATAHLVGDGIEVIAADVAGEPIGAPQAMLAFMGARRDPWLPLTVVGPRRLEVALSVYVEAHPDYLQDAVELAVREALFGAEGRAGFFAFLERGLGSPLFLSRVYERLVAVPGVDFVRVEKLEVVAADVGRVLDVVAAAPDQWVSLDPVHFAFVAPGGAP